MQSTILIFLAAFLVAAILPAQSDKLYPVKKLQKDFDQLASMVEAHPVPYRHITEKDFYNFCRAQI